MALTIEQQKTVKKWVDEGAGLSQVQTRIKAEFGVSLTFLDTRMLVQELGANLKDKPEPKKTAPAPAPKAHPGEDDLDDLEEEEPGTAPADGLIGGKVTVSLDRIVRPGAVVSGDVTFSDGKTAKWLLDQTGRLALEGANPAYRPPTQDIQEFQTQLRALLQTRGY